MATRAPRKRGKKDIKAAADRAEKRSKGEEVIGVKSPVLEPEETKGSPGRPTKYTQEIADLICARLATGMSLRAACRPNDVVAESTARSWAQDPKHPFSAHYVRAREIGYLSLADECFDIADDASNDWMVREGKDGESLGWQLNGDHVQRSKLRIDTRKWMLSKCLPKIYGDRVSTEISGPDGAPIQVETVDRMAMARWIAMTLAQATPVKAIDVTAG